MDTSTMTDDQLLQQVPDPSIADELRRRLAEARSFVAERDAYMTTCYLGKDKQRAVLADLRRRWDLKRYVKARSRDVMAATFGIKNWAVWHTLAYGRCRRLTSEQIKELRAMEAERLDALARLQNDYSIEGISRRNGVALITVRRYENRCIVNHEAPPLSAENRIGAA